MFSWIVHIKTIKTKVSKAVGAMYRVKDKVNEITLLIIYNTLILPHLQYCCELWGNTYNCRINYLIVLQKQAVRLIYRVAFRVHTSEIFKKFNILKFKALINFHKGVLMYKTSNTMLPENSKLQFSNIQDIHKYGTKNKEKMFVYTCSANSRLKQMPYNVKRVKLWNELNSKIRNSKSLNVFKRRLKYEYVSNY